METDWPFEDPRNVAVFTLRQIIRERRPILLVTHDEDEGDWQFLDGSQVLSEEDAMIVALGNIAKRDPSILQLADLPLGWVAWRDTPEAPWQRAPRADVYGPASELP